MLLTTLVDKALIDSKRDVDEVRTLFADMGVSMKSLLEKHRDNPPGFEVKTQPDLVTVSYADVTLDFRLVVQIDLLTKPWKGARGVVHCEWRRPLDKRELIDSFEYDYKGQTKFDRGDGQPVGVRNGGRDLALHYIAAVLAKKNR